mmetsp:Transcript_18045/g.21572  ORF Transcript_18045/g.21572 Transcript_18045/m.21572 type:complete len:354 (-) Transcript_18045:460-1521(-)
MSNPGYSDCDMEDSVDDDNGASTGDGSNPVSANKDSTTEKLCTILFPNNRLDEVIHSLTSAIESITVGPSICTLIKDLRTYLREEHRVEVSDRRLVKAVRLLKISAATNGRVKVDPIDCLLLQHMTWRVPEQRVWIRDWLWDNLIPSVDSGGAIDGSSTEGSTMTEVDQFRLLLNNLRHEIITALRKTSGDVTGIQGGRNVDVALIQSLQMEVRRISTVLQRRRDDLARHMETLEQSGDHLWLDPDEAISARQLLLPRTGGFVVELRKMAVDARALDLSLSSSDNSDGDDGVVVVLNDVRISVIEQIWEDNYRSDVNFSEDELSMGMRDAKAKYDIEMFRKWKRAKKRIQKEL